MTNSTTITELDLSTAALEDITAQPLLCQWGAAAGCRNEACWIMRCACLGDGQEYGETYLCQPCKDYWYTEPFWWDPEGEIMCVPSDRTWIAI